MLARQDSSRSLRAACHCSHLAQAPIGQMRPMEAWGPRSQAKTTSCVTRFFRLSQMSSFRMLHCPSVAIATCILDFSVNVFDGNPKFKTETTSATSSRKQNTGNIKETDSRKRNAAYQRPFVPVAGAGFRTPDDTKGRQKANSWRMRRRHNLVSREFVVKRRVLVLAQSP